MLYNWQELKKTLTDYERELIESRYGSANHKAHTFRQLGKMYGRPESTVRYHLKKITQKLLI